MSQSMIRNAVIIMSTVIMIAYAPALGQQQAPGFTLPDVHGNEHSLEDHKGKIVVLEWINYDCPFVRKFYSVGAMQAWQDQYTEKGVVWLSICSSAPGTQGHFSQDEWLKRIEEANVNIPVLLDEDGTVGRAYGAQTTPHMFIINAEGSLVYQGAIDDTRSTRPADIKTARNYVTEALDALLNGKPIDVSESRAYGCSVKYN